jgi:enoyl-CoA hydratase/carnithine racemase
MGERNMSWKDIEVQRTGRVAVARFDRSDNLNALSLDLMRDLLEVARSFEQDIETTAVVLTGSAHTFTAGLDLRDPKILEAMNAPLGTRRHLVGFGPKMCRAWEELQQITIVAIEGHCVGGGVSLAVSCDFRVMGSGAFFRVPELELGMNMSWQTLPRLVHLVGPARAKRIVLLAERIDAEAASNWGLADEIAEDGSALNRALELAQRIADLPPLPAKMTKQSINAIANALDNSISYMDADQFMLCHMTQDHAEAIAAFLEKRKPAFKGR